MATRSTRIVVGLLCLIGIVAAVERLVLTAGPGGGDFADYDRAKFLMLTRIKGIASGSPAESDIIDFSARIYAKFGTHRTATFLHLLPGIGFLALAPLQFSRRFRTRSLRRHRVLGRILLLAGVAPALTSMYFGVLSNAAVPSASFFFGACFIFAAGKGFIAIRRGDVTRHREWMIRMFAVAAGISTVRLVATAIFFTPLAFPNLFPISFWIGELVTIGVAEIYIRTDAKKDRLAPAF